MLSLFRNLFAPPRDLILLILAAWAGLTLAEKRAKRSGFSAETLNNLVFVGLLAYILGGRLFYAAEHLPAFEQSPISLISLNITIFDYWGALAAALIAALAYGQRKQLPLWPTLDALTPFFASIAVGLGLLHLASGAAFGEETNLPWGIYLWGATRHPTQIYEILASLLTLGLLWSRKTDAQPGTDVLLFVALTSAGRLVIEAFRGDSTLVPGGLRLAQVMAWMALVIALLGLESLGSRSRLPPVTAGKNLVTRSSSGKSKVAAQKKSVRGGKKNPGASRQKSRRK